MEIGNIQQLTIKDYQAQLAEKDTEIALLKSHLNPEIVRLEELHTELARKEIEKKDAVIRDLTTRLDNLVATKKETIAGAISWWVLVKDLKFITSNDVVHLTDRIVNALQHNEGG